jgi:DNA polymerase-3 subunit delta'
MTATQAPSIAGIPPDPGYRERYPWHADTWARLTRDLARLPHALLLHGSPGLGKRAFTWRLAQSLLCATPSADAQACNVCVNCRRFAAGTHPDLVSVAPGEESVLILIDQIRAVRDFAALKPHTAARKVMIVEPAEAMNLNAANALLKLLEEPPMGSVLLLITARFARLPATIRSRCVAVAFRAPDKRATAAWLRERGVADPGTLLELAAAAPLTALALEGSSAREDRVQLSKDIEALRRGADDALRCATRWKGYGVERALSWFQSHVAAMIRREMADGKIGLQVRGLFRYFDVLSEAKSLAQGPLDEVLLLEDLLIRWVRIFRSPGLN